MVVVHSHHVRKCQVACVLSGNAEKDSGIKVISSSCGDSHIVSQKLYLSVLVTMVMVMSFTKIKSLQMNRLVLLLGFKIGQVDYMVF